MTLIIQEKQAIKWIFKILEFQNIFLISSIFKAAHSFSKKKTKYKEQNVFTVIYINKHLINLIHLYVTYTRATGHWVESHFIQQNYISFFKLTII